MRVKDFKLGQRVQSHPATDRWMRGQRFGTVVDLGRTVVGVRFDRGSGSRIVRVKPMNLLTVEE